jgi:hypothetical protein
MAFLLPADFSEGTWLGSVSRETKDRAKGEDIAGNAVTFLGLGEIPTGSADVEGGSSNDSLDFFERLCPDDPGVPPTEIGVG